MKRYFSPAIALLCALSLNAALPTGPTLNWDVRTTGNNNNGGAFLSTGTGTDFSQQGAAQQAYTDLVIGTPNTTITSVLHPFDATTPGNIINITGGTGFTVGRFLVLSVAGAVATLDRAAGTIASLGGTANLGGALATIAQANSLLKSGNIVYMKSGTYTQTATNTITLSSTWIGFNATHTDRGTKPLITTATNSTALFTSNASVEQVYLNMQNLSMSNTAATRAAAFNPTISPINNLFLTDVILDGFQIAIDGTTGFFLSIRGTKLEIKNSISHATEIDKQTASSSSFVCEACYIHNNAGNAVNIVTNTVSIVLVNSILTLNANGIVIAASINPNIHLVNSTISLNTTDGITNASLISATLATNCIFWGNGQYAVNFSGGQVNGVPAIVGLNNAYGGQGTANFNNVAGSPGDIALTGNPFTSATNFAINSTAGAGALLKATGYPGIFPGGTTTGFLDVGPVQTQCAGTAARNYAGCGLH